MTSSVLDDMATHLEFLGYELVRDSDWVGARHRTKLNLRLRDFAGGVLLSAVLFGNAAAKENRLDYLSFLNTMNQKAAVARFYADDDSDCTMEAWHPGLYERSKFGDFVSQWERDGERLLMAPEAQTYFS